jgi:hypothetical protein
MSENEVEETEQPKEEKKEEIIPEPTTLLNYKLQFVFGIDQKKRNNLHIIGVDKVAYVSGNVVVIHDLITRKQMYFLFFHF